MRLASLCAASASLLEESLAAGIGVVARLDDRVLMSLVV